MAARKPFLLRMDPRLYEALQRWAADELRSLNGQVEYLLRDALVRSGRLMRQGEPSDRRASQDDDVEPPSR